MLELSVLLPYKPDNGPRDEAFRWTRAFYRKYMQNAEICIGHSESALFSRAQAINDAARQATTDLFLIADTDIVYDPRIILEAKQKLNTHAWVIPYSQVQDISEPCTKQLLGTEPVWPFAMPLDSTVRTYSPKGGLTLMPRKHFEAVKGLDERFIGWGGEDDAFASSLDTLCGQHDRLQEAIYHLWHPNNKENGNPNYANNFNLFLRYMQAYGNAASMRELVSSRQASSDSA
jgi:hypothetical protein